MNDLWQILGLLIICLVIYIGQTPQTRVNILNFNLDFLKL